MKKLILKNFNKETKEINKLFDNLDLNKLKNFNKLCEDSIKVIKNGIKISRRITRIVNNKIKTRGRN